MAEQLGDLGGLREYVDAVEARRRVDEAEVLIGGAAEDREGRQREARGELGVDGVGEADSAVAGGRQRGGRGARGGRETHGFVHGKGMKARRNGEIWGELGFSRKKFGRKRNGVGALEGQIWKRNCQVNGGEKRNCVGNDYLEKGTSKWIWFL